MATASYSFTRGSDYSSIVATSEKVAWTVEEIFRDRRFDATNNIIPNHGGTQKGNAAARESCLWRRR